MYVNGGGQATGNHTDGPKNYSVGWGKGKDVRKGETGRGEHSFTLKRNHVVIRYLGKVGATKKVTSRSEKTGGGRMNGPPTASWDPGKKLRAKKELSALHLKHWSLRWRGGKRGNRFKEGPRELKKAGRE